MGQPFSMSSVYMWHILINCFGQHIVRDCLPLAHASKTRECIYKIEKSCKIVCAVCHSSCGQWFISKCVDILLMNLSKVWLTVLFYTGYSTLPSKALWRQLWLRMQMTAKQKISIWGKAHHCCPADLRSADVPITTSAADHSLSTCRGRERKG